jgi:PAS domain-containing protein
MPEDVTRNEFQNRIHELEREIASRKADQERLQQIVSSLDVALSVIHPDKTIAWVNDGILQMFPDGNPLGRRCHQFYEMSEEPCEDCPADRTFATGDVIHVERYNPAFGRRSWNHRWTQMHTDKGGRASRLVCRRRGVKGRTYCQPEPTAVTRHP